MVINMMVIGKKIIEMEKVKYKGFLGILTLVEGEEFYGEWVNDAINGKGNVLIVYRNI